jgi:hypothetical protein
VDVTFLDKLHCQEFVADRSSVPPPGDELIPLPRPGRWWSLLSSMSAASACQHTPRVPRQGRMKTNFYYNPL